MEGPVRGADLDPPPHDTPPPDGATEPPINHPPKQIRGPTNEGGPLEALRGEASQRATGQMSLTLARAPEGMMPIGAWPASWSPRPANARPHRLGAMVRQTHSQNPRIPGAEARS